jgi:hypothetical protein
MTLMTIHFSYDRKVRVFIEGTVVKKVFCENCKTDFIYEMTRKASASASPYLGIEEAEKKVVKEAKKELTNRLRGEIDAVPCPKCGWYQRAMFPIAREEYWAWFRGAGCLLILLAILLALAYIAWPLPRDWAVVWVSCFGIGYALLVFRKVMSLRYDPNATDLDARLKLARSRCPAEGSRIVSYCSRCGRVDDELQRRGYCLHCGSDDV